MALLNTTYFFFCLNIFKFQLATVPFDIYPKEMKMFVHQTLNNDVSNNYYHHFPDLETTKMHFGTCIQTTGYH